MSTYRKIHGRSIQAVTTDPTGDVTEGQVWYNTTSDTFKSVLNVEAWASASPMISAKKAAMPGGIQTAAFTAGGNDGSTNVNSTFEYNGSGFSSGGNINTTRRGGSGGGTLTAGIICGGFITAVSNATEEYDGTSWTSGNNMNTSRSGQAGFGTQTANVISGGQPGQGTTTEEYDGTNWTTVNTNPTDGSERAGDGILTAGITFGGHTPAPAKISSSELYDGTNWTSAPSLNTARERLSGFGPQSSAYAFGGDSATTTVAFTENYNGTSWSEIGDMATARKENQSGQTGSSTTGVAMGGNTAPGADIDTTEEFTSSINVITAATFSSGGNTNVAGQARSPASGTQTASTIVGANQGPPSWYSNVTEHYNGSSWTNGGNYPTDAGYLINEGTETATIAAFNGYYTGSSFLVPQASNEYNGSSWTAGNSYAGSARYGVGAFGTQTAALAACGSIVPADSQVQSDIYDGTNWTSGPNAVNERQRTCGTGILTAGIIGAGYANTPSPSSVNYANASNIEEYDGSSFSNSGAVLFNQAWQQGVFGTSTSAIFFGGNNAPAGITAANEFNGTICITAPNMANQRAGGGGGGTTTAGLACSGAPPTSLPSGNKTEEFTGEIVTANVKTLTQS